ncbi:hypothetical protein DE146DRAFT_195302 [Phaeosphaeria sp. MPI-PUGE-AT-0046c]|nr:hypothetical protein DE146DRAFT_195302 [Phaeosphaeria sp. MPI-PUGE-AT-0046c]
MSSSSSISTPTVDQLENSPVQQETPPADSAYWRRKEGEESVWKKTKVAKTPGTQQDPPQHLKPGDTHVTCELTRDIKITFNEQAERMRAQGSLLPRKLYRTAYEGSGTLSQFVTPDCLTKHRDVPHLKLHEENAFQNVGDFDLIHDMNRYQMERQLVTLKKKDPSPFVSTTSDYAVAKKRASTQYNRSRLVGHRVYIAEINTAGLVPATLHSDEQLVETLYVENSLTMVTSDANKSRVHIAVWIRDTARPADGFAITPQHFYESGADMYVSVDEQRVSDLVVRACTNHNN